MSAPGAAADLRLLPGQYAQSTNPELLHSLLTTSSASISGSAGFSNSSSLSLPLSVDLQPGIVFYDGANYSSSAKFIALPTSANASNVTSAVDANSFVLSSDTWAEVKTSSARLILWDASPDVAQLPGSLQGLTLAQIQSGSCSTPCSSGGICTSQGSCACLPGFTGSSCESCQSGFFGAQCQACPSNCTQCDDGIGGTGACLKVETTTQNCNCLNGQCQSDGSCACNAGWADSSNGTKCAQCANGFFLSNDGSCKGMSKRSNISVLMLTVLLQCAKLDVTLAKLPQVLVPPVSPASRSTQLIQRNATHPPPQRTRALFVRTVLSRMGQLAQPAMRLVALARVQQLMTVSSAHPASTSLMARALRRIPAVSAKRV